MDPKFRELTIRLAAAKIKHNIQPDPEAPEFVWEIYVELRLKVAKVLALATDEEVMCERFRSTAIRVCAGLMMGHGLPGGGTKAAA